MQLRVSALAKYAAQLRHTGFYADQHKYKFAHRHFSYDMMPKRISIRGLLIVIACVAVACGLARPTYRRIKWFDHRSRLVDWAANLKRERQRNESYAILWGAGQQFVVSTSELIVAPDYSSATYDGATPDPIRFFVVPPGKWVDTIDDVLDTWDEYD